MVLDWGIMDNETCKGAKTNTTSFACGNNTTCYDFEDVGGYFCKCLSGYKGNPYLLDGCRGSYTVHFLYVLCFNCFADIDECADPTLNQCVAGSKTFKEATWKLYMLLP
ncbi:hypothetical protein ACSBR1_001228 [Camellia fascicularis]